MQTPKRQPRGYHDLNNDQHQHHHQTHSYVPTTPLSPSSFVEQGLSLLGLSPQGAFSPSRNHNPSHSHMDIDTNAANMATPNRRRLSPHHRVNNGRQSSKERRRARSHTPNPRPSLQPSLQFLSSDDSNSIADLAFNQYSYDTPSLNEMDHNNVIHLPMDNTGHLGHNNNEPANNGGNNNGRKARRRRLNWRVGPLQRKRKPKRPTIRQPPSTNSLNSNEDHSIAERTVKSFHTCHSTETIKAENNKNQNCVRQQPRPTATLLIPPRSSVGTPNSKKTISSLYQTAAEMAPMTPSSISTTSTAATTPLSLSSSDVESDDDGSIITPLDSPQSEDKNRTIGLFLYDNERQNHYRQNNNGANQPGARGHIHQQKRVGLPPRSPFVTTKSFSDVHGSFSLQYVVCLS